MFKRFSKYWDKSIYNDKRLPLDLTPKKGESQNDTIIRVFKDRGLIDKNATFHPIKRPKMKY